MGPHTEDSGPCTLQNRGERLRHGKCLSTQFGHLCANLLLGWVEVRSCSFSDPGLESADGGRERRIYMNAPVEEDAVDRVLLPPNITINGMKVIVLL